LKIVVFESTMGNDSNSSLRVGFITASPLNASGTKPCRAINAAWHEAAVEAARAKRVL
jgi:hypothetical protein